MSKKNNLIGLVVLALFAVTLPLLGGFVESAKAATTATMLTITATETEVEANKPFSITVKATDDTTAVITDYLGTVTFSVADDDQAIVPDDYTFVAADKGVKEFTDEITLTKLGEQIITVTDTTDETLIGEISLEVIAATTDTNDTTPTTTNPDAEVPEILSPTDTTTVNEKTLDIIGTAPQGTELTVYDSTEILGKVTTDEDGSFTYQTPTLYDGNHSFKVSYLDEQKNEISSEVVNVRVDATSAVIQDVVLNPSEANTGATFTITVTAEKNMAKVNALMDQRTVNLTEDLENPGMYTAEMLAPATAGEYSLDIEITDQSKNTQTYEDQATLTVIAGATNQPPTVTASANEVSGKAPFTVKFKGIASDPDGTVVAYAWDFGDGTTGTGAEITHTFQLEGTYQVSLTATDDKGANATVRMLQSNNQQFSGITVQSGPALIATLLIAFGLNGYLFYRKQKRLN